MRPSRKALLATDHQSQWKAWLACEKGNEGDEEVGIEGKRIESVFHSDSLLEITMLYCYVNELIDICGAQTTSSEDSSKDIRKT